MTEADQNGDQRELRKDRPFQPAQRRWPEVQVRTCGQRDRLVAVHRDGNETPDDQDHHHHSRGLHDAQGLLAGFVNADSVLPPEVDLHDQRKTSREVLRFHMPVGLTQVLADFIEQTGEIQTRADAADRSGEHVIEHQRRHRKLGQRAAQCFMHDLVHSAAHEHAAAFDVDGAHGKAKQHDAEDEPGGALADGGFGDAADVVSRRGQITQDDSGGPPERDERQHDRRRNDHFGRARRF